MAYYNDNLIDAVALAETLWGLDQFVAAADADQSKALELASLRIDAVKFQGRKYDSEQVKHFPRVNCVLDGIVSDWDADTATAVVPLQIKQAELYEAQSILVGELDRVNAAIAAGLTAQTTGSLSESYRVVPGGANPFESLCADTRRLLTPYRLRTGVIL